MEHRSRAARVAASNAVVVTYPMPRGLLRWRATAVVPNPDPDHLLRVTAPGLTSAAAERRARRAIVRELLAGWWA